MRHRLVIERSPEGSVDPSEEQLRQVDAPSLAALRLVFGVGASAEAAPGPGPGQFHAVYTVSMPISSPGGLDPDGVYEFDAGAQLELLQARAQRRRWALRLELEFVQSSQAVNAAELWITTPWRDAQPRPLLLDTGPGQRRPGGGRAYVVASTPVTTPVAARELGGRFTAQLRDADPESDAPPTIESPVLEVRCDFSCYEFEAEGPRAF